MGFRDEWFVVVATDMGGVEHARFVVEQDAHRYVEWMNGRGHRLAVREEG